MGQFFALMHSVEHPFHESAESCQVYFVLEQSGNGLTCDGIASIFSGFHSNCRVDFISALVSQSLTSCHIRAPPLLS
ncbi:hypothetical protein [Candidatus Venteria ishoeyi]|uniref:hypothetical protein n=1 Tax=Candidatus Venteria ishoeyi TaxID=1899563 RepID=UPI0011B06BA4|nr:hypothetical protein [Candidatus Venteria ishoeyi]